jgi:hypothetical protein
MNSTALPYYYPFQQHVIESRCFLLLPGSGGVVEERGGDIQHGNNNTIISCFKILWPLHLYDRRTGGMESRKLHQQQQCAVS